jgi:hypothetical protein
MGAELRILFKYCTSPHLRQYPESVGEGGMVNIETRGVPTEM